MLGRQCPPYPSAGDPKRPTSSPSSRRRVRMPPLYERIADLSQPLQTEHFSVAFDQRVGSLIRLQSGDTDWAGPANPLGTFWYETYSAADYARYRRQYLINKRTTSWYARPDFTKPGIEGEASEHRVFRPRVTWSGRRIGDQQEAVLLLLDLPAEAHERFGAPGQLSIELVFPRGEPRVDFVVQWFDKPANRLPEAAWFSFVLPDHGPRWRRSWRMDKLGEWVSPAGCRAKWQSPSACGRERPVR